ncbi:MAG: 23S rRNA (guanosine(2251)-2'-O)-methyltransferase RlmB [Holosporales bacterium]|jgi:23S rRNA (guanosine2251-2'-O)-methyltransferase|nr:23S rRNA (guanosine(2251)-2'-O)-methyltransferase RlmB [Holosporales bacterium]
MQKSGNQQWICGKRAVKACLENVEREVFKVVVQDDFGDICNLAKRQGIAVDLVRLDWFDRKFPDQVHQKIAACIGNLRQKSLVEIIDEGKNVVILDLVTDPHNVGAILRSAAAFGIGAVIIQNKGSPQENNSIVSKTSSGATELVPLIREINLTRAIEQLKKGGYWCVSLTEQGTEPLDAIDMRGKTALIIGGEGDGIRRLVLENSDFKAYIPNTRRDFSVLNAAQAATIGMYELAKLKKDIGGKK